MGNANYLKGVAFEREFMKEHEASGNFMAIRTAGSHSPFDVILIPLGSHSEFSTIVCQLKRHKGSAPKPPESFVGLDLGMNVTKWWVTRQDRKQTVIQVV